LTDARWSALYREPMTCDFVSSSSNRCGCLWCRPSPRLPCLPKQDQLLVLRVLALTLVVDGSISYKVGHNMYKSDSVFTHSLKAPGFNPCCMNL
jgi:hypothetical protein